MPDFLRPRGRRNDKEFADDGETELETMAPWMYTGSSDDEAARETEDVRVEAKAEDVAPVRRVAEPAPLSLANVGEHVASVLASAEAAAQKIRAEAEQEAKDLRQDATRIATEIRTRATEEAQVERAATRRLVDEAETSSHGIRSDADRYAEEGRREADSQAAQIIRDAERRAASIADSSGDRHRVLLTNIAASETRLRELAKSLRGVAVSLDEVVGSTDADPVDDGIGREREAMLLEESLGMNVAQSQPDVATRP